MELTKEAVEFRPADVTGESAEGALR